MWVTRGQWCHVAVVQRIVNNECSRTKRRTSSTLATWPKSSKTFQMFSSSSLLHLHKMQDVMATPMTVNRQISIFGTHYLAPLQINMHQTSRMILNFRSLLRFGIQTVMEVETPSVTRCRPPFMTNYLAPNQTNWHQTLRMILNNRSLLTFEMQVVMAVETSSVTCCRPPFMTNYLAPNQINGHQT